MISGNSELSKCKGNIKWEPRTFPVFRRKKLISHFNLLIIYVHFNIYFFKSGSWTQYFVQSFTTVWYSESHKRDFAVAFGINFPFTTSCISWVFPWKHWCIIILPCVHTFTSSANILYCIFLLWWIVEFTINAEYGLWGLVTSSNWSDFRRQSMSGQKKLVIKQDFSLCRWLKKIKQLSKFDSSGYLYDVCSVHTWCLRLFFFSWASIVYVLEDKRRGEVFTRSIINSNQ